MGEHTYEADSHAFHTIPNLLPYHTRANSARAQLASSAENGDRADLDLRTTSHRPLRLASATPSMCGRPLGLRS